MRRAAISYEDLIAEKESLQAAMDDLSKTRKEIASRVARPA